MKLVGVPVTTSRAWTSALTPHANGWRFITQSWNLDEDKPTEWAIVDLEPGAVRLQNGPNRIYANSNFQVPSANTAIVHNNQLRAPNGRIFFPERATPGNDDQLNLAYYDPADERIHQLAIEDPSGGRHAIVFRGDFDRDGTKLFLGTQSQIGNRPFVFALDPQSLELTAIGSVGTAFANQPRFAYYIAADGEWLYVAVGQGPWELVAINLATGAQSTLLTTTGPGTQTIELETRANGLAANTYTNGVNTRYWLADGALSAYPGTGAPPCGARAVGRYGNPLASPPQIDHSRGIGQLLWRPHGSTGGWIQIDYQVANRSPVAIESLHALSDGTVLGSVEQYGGFFRHDPELGTTRWFGAWSGASRPVICETSPSAVYIAAYPSGALYRYDPRRPWQITADARSNPIALGGYGINVRYPYFLGLGDNGKLYACGRRERDSLGSGIGVYDVALRTYMTTVAGLDAFIPRGFVVLPSMLVYSGEVIGTAASEGQIITFNYGLMEQRRWTVFPGRRSTGVLFPTLDANVVLGVLSDLVYRFDVSAGSLLEWVSVGSAPLTAATQRADGKVIATIGGVLTRIDPTTLARTPLETVGAASRLACRGRDSFMAVGPALHARPSPDAARVAALDVLVKLEGLITGIGERG